MNICEKTITAANLRLYRAREDYSAAKFLLDKGFYRAANERAFFGMYHAARAVLAFVGIGINGTSAVVEYFTDKFIGNGHFDPGIYKIFKAGLKARDNGDYNDYHIETKKESLRTVENAGVFIETMRIFVARQIALDTFDSEAPYSEDGE